jgi:hypothetical protein
MEKECPYGFGKTAPLPLEEAVGRVRESLAEQSFGVLTRSMYPRS